MAVRPRDGRESAHGDEPGRYGAGGGRPDSRHSSRPGEYPELPWASDLDAERGLAQDRLRALDMIAERVRGAEPGEMPGRLCAVAVDLLPVAGASVALHGAGLPVRLSASSEQAVRVAEIQATLGDGPCLYAARTGAPVLACDLTAGWDVSRWPVFAQQATAAGVRATYSIPLGTDEVCVGTLDLYRDTPGELAYRDLRTARLVASMMTVALMALPRGDENGNRGTELWLSGLAKDQDEVYQAVGMIMAQLGVDSDEALARLRAHAFAESRTALELAHEVVGHRTRFDRFDQEAVAEAAEDRDGDGDGYDADRDRDRDRD